MTAIAYVCAAVVVPTDPDTGKPYPLDVVGTIVAHALHNRGRVTVVPCDFTPDADTVRDRVDGDLLGVIDLSPSRSPLL